MLCKYGLVIPHCFVNPKTAGAPKISGVRSQKKLLAPLANYFLNPFTEVPKLDLYSQYR